jgi:hypothetical protein
MHQIELPYLLKQLSTYRGTVSSQNSSPKSRYAERKAALVTLDATVPANMLHPVRWNLSTRLINHGTMFFFLTTKQHQPTYQPQKPSTKYNKRQIF